MITIADTTPINSLILIELIDVLPALYGRVLIPDAVRSELRSEHSPAATRAWAENLPDWAVVQNPVTVWEFGLDAGETAALSLALEHQQSFLLIDERKGRRIAQRHHLPITGTLGVLREAAAARLINLPDAVRRLQQTSFQASPVLIQQILDGDAA